MTMDLSLVDKFFKEDLTETEQDALGDLLASSDEAALRFGGNAQAAYVRFGLPKPPVPPSTSALPIPAGWVVLGLLAVSSGVWWVSRTHGPATEAPVAPPAAVSPALSRPAAPARKDAPPKAKLAVAPRQEVPAAQPAVAPNEEAPAAQPAVAPREEAPAMRPAQGLSPADTAAPKSYPLLKVVVSQKSAGNVVVRVISPSGGEVRRLYEGTLPAGEWSFTWDGRLTDGTSAAPGRYVIETNNGYAIQSQDVIVK